jgi:indole-3-glycerol phosphate synthase
LDPKDAAVQLARGGATSLSVLTEPDNFGGSMANLRRIREKVDLPLLMKDIIVDKTQIHAGRRAGADCILLIESVFSTGNEPSLEGLLRDAHDSRLEVLLEVHTEEELEKALGREADIIGLNNRNLATLETNLNTTTRLLRRINNGFRKPVISESGFENANDIRKVKSIAVHGFLIGSSIMLSNDMERKVREFVVA